MGTEAMVFGMFARSVLSECARRHCHISLQNRAKLGVELGAEEINTSIFLNRLSDLVLFALGRNVRLRYQQPPRLVQKHQCIPDRNTSRFGPRELLYPYVVDELTYDS